MSSCLTTVPHFFFTRSDQKSHTLLRLANLQNDLPVCYTKPSHAALLTKRMGKYKGNVGVIEWREPSCIGCSLQSGRFVLLRNNCSSTSFLVILIAYFLRIPKEKRTLEKHRRRWKAKVLSH